MQNIKALSNIEINKKENSCLVSINPTIYPLDIIYPAAYVFLDRAYILIDGNPKENVIVQLKPKKKYNLKTLGQEFNNELLNYAAYKTFSEKTSKIRELIVHRALFTNDPGLAVVEDGDYAKDPKGIAIPWEEKHNRKAKKKLKKK